MAQATTRPRWLPETLSSHPSATLTSWSKLWAIFEERRDGRRIRVQVFPEKVSSRVEDAEEELGPWIVPAEGVCRVYAVEREGRLLVFVADWPRDQILADRLDEPLPMAAALRLLLALSRVMAGIEEDEPTRKAWIPGRISPWSIWADEDGGVCVDAPPLAAVESASVALRRPIRHMGYLAPEQISAGPVDLRTDLFLAGVMGYELLTGVHPFLGSSSSETIRNITSKSPPPPSNHAPWIPRDVDAAILAALRKDPARRPASFSVWRAMLEDVSQAVIEPPAEAPPDPEGVSIAAAILGAPAGPLAEAPTHLISDEEEPLHDRATTILDHEDEEGATSTVAAHPDLVTASTRTREEPPRASRTPTRKKRSLPILEMALAAWLLAALAGFAFLGDRATDNRDETGTTWNPRVQVISARGRRWLRVDVEAGKAGSLFLMTPESCIPALATSPGTAWFEWPADAPGRLRICEQDGARLRCRSFRPRGRRSRGSPLSSGS